MTNTTKIIRQREKTKTQTKITGKINYFEMAECILAFFMNKICLFGALSPFGISYFAAIFPTHYTSFAMVSAFLGIMLSGFGVTSLKYIGALSLYMIFTLLYNKDISNKMWISAVVSSVSLIISGTVFIIMDGFLVYDMLLLFLESILCFISFFAFNNASVVLRTFKNRKVFEPTDLLGVVFLFSSLLLATMSIPGFEPVAQILAVSAIILIAYTQGFHLSCAAGLVLGIVMSINSLLPSHVICTYTISALCAGLLKNYGKLGVSFGFVFANALMMIYLNSSTVTIINIACSICGSLVVFLLPKNLTDKIGNFANTPLGFVHSIENDYQSDIISQKLSDASNSLYELSGIFETITKQSTQTNELSPGAIFDATIDMVCKNCNLCTYCWHKNYDDTIQMAGEMFSQMSNRGYAIEFDAPPEFRSSCIRFDDFLGAVNKNYEIQKINISWASKVLESKNIVSQQFKNISSILTGISTEIKRGFVRDSELELKIRAELDKKGIGVKNVKVIFSDCYEVFLSVESCGKKRVCRDLISTTVAAVIGVPVYIENRNCGETECTLKFCEKTKFSTDVAFAKTSDNKTLHSGDSHICSALPGGKYMLCISDGMGRGKNAASQSKITVSLIKKLLSLGFDKEISLKILNTFLLLKSSKETFATADVCLINLHSGALEFIKSGAVNSYVKSQNSAIKIKCSSLPAGTVSNLDVDCDLLYAKDGDFVVMTTDGITDLLEKGEQNFLKDIIESYSGTSPQDLANRILKAALERRTDASCDDMTVLVSKITEEL